MQAFKLSENLMKLIHQYTLFLSVVMAMAGILISCSEDDLPNNGQPSIDYIRVTSPASADSMIVSAGQGAAIGSRPSTCW